MFAVARADIAQDRAQLGDIGARLFRGAYVGLGDDLHKRDAGAVEIDMALGRGEFVQRLAGVLLKVQSLDADGDALVGDTSTMTSPSPTIGFLNCEI